MCSLEDEAMAHYQVGDYVRVEFKDESDPIGEWMWVRVESCNEQKRLVFGVLDNEPVSELGGRFGLGSRLAVDFDKIREQRKPWEFTRQLFLSANS